MRQQQGTLFPLDGDDEDLSEIVSTAPRGLATLSGDGVYRYSLSRYWTERPSNRLVVWIMLNPSTADALADDPTIRRCIDFTRRWGYDGMVVVNLYALRATDPRELRRHPDPVGPDNLDHLGIVLRAAGKSTDRPVIAAWGANARDEAVAVVTRMAHQHRVTLGCLGVTKHGAPRHPLYMRADTIPIPLNPALRTFPRSTP